MNRQRQTLTALTALSIALNELRALQTEYPAMEWAVREVTDTRDALVRLFDVGTL